ncbi:J domain-containing protein DDB_G0295729 [Parasteatoda tepidariorum]|uniref:J domain-containing protein DDB_G0295729 n=1 Tax=Parasteatoda tepidariorum TaxID=114398 RepID=UPI00077FD618|nr:uncharacterized protein LOC107453026 [Parasteatoda tepidariorum]XP_015925181.1 uncharacterized protein LOC107453026 [Parasteatoda tepidariorum]
MGNSHSQSVSRFAPSLLHNHENNHKEGKKFSSKFASPENRVLPIASNPPQRLRSTDNGCILQNGGTISGRKANPVSEPEFVQVLQKKCHSMQSTLYGHRKSHSDPDIVRMMMNDSDEDDSDIDGRCEETINKRSIIAVSPSKAKIKSRKKKRAPQPPQSNTLPRTLSRIPVSYNNENPRTNKCCLIAHDYGDTPRRPLPPIPPEEMPPPPPPPPPDYNKGSDDVIALKTVSKNYEKNRRTVEKWKFRSNQESVEKRKRCKSLDRVEEQRIRENVENRTDRCQRNNSLRNLTCSESNLYPSGEDEKPLNFALKDAITDAAKKRAERIKREHRNQSFKLSMQHSQDSKERCEPPTNKHFHGYRNDVQQIHRNSNSKHERQSRNDKFVTDHRDVPNLARNSSLHKISSITRNDYEYNIRNNDMVTQLEQKHFSPRLPKVSAPDYEIRQNKWEPTFLESNTRFNPEGAISSSTPSEEELEIDLQLRPTLPRRPVEISRFSPTDVWKSINLDFFKSHQQRSDVSSDDADDLLEEKICRINRPVAPRKLIHDRSGDSGISPDAGSPMLINESLETLVMNNIQICNASPDEHNSMWVPQHDLADDSECGSDNSPSDDRNRPSKNIQAKFSMPNLMFPSRSLPRTDQRNVFDEILYPEKEKIKSKGRRKKSCKNSEGQHFNSLRNLKKALGLRTKAPVEENKGLDSNWSLSRSLPNFINNLNVEKPENETTEMYILEHVRRSNSESKARQQERETNKSPHGNPVMNPEWKKSFPGQSSEGHVIYLPEYKSTPLKKHSIVDDIYVNTDSELVMKKPINRKKYSYQSTVKQEEKKKLEEKLAREVEARERKRQEEIEWMNKVEEEFRKQRDKEKVNIRHQLRILSLQEKSPKNLNHLYERELHENDVAEYIESVCKLYPSPETPHEAQHTYNDLIAESNWQQPTGMKKWLKRQNRDCPTRPEPEGGRSSSDDCKQMDGKKSSDRRLQNNSNYYKNSRCKCEHGNDCSICEGSFKRKTRNFSRNELSADPIYNQTSIVHSSISKQEVHSCLSHENGVKNNSLMPDSNKSRFTPDSVEEHELHTRLCRTNSGRTFESHSYYALERRKDEIPDYDPFKKMNGDKKPNLFSTLNFEKELKENVRKKTREFEKRTRKYQSCDYNSDESGSDGQDHQRQSTRNQKRKSEEPSFTRNHPHRNGGRGKQQVNNHHVNGRSSIYIKSGAILPQQRILSCS